MKMVEIVGKRTRPVPILMSQDMLNAMDVLVATRCACDMNSDYFFALPGQSSIFILFFKG